MREKYVYNTTQLIKIAIYLTLFFPSCVYLIAWCS